MKKKESRESSQASETPDEETTSTETGASSDDAGSPEEGFANIGSSKKGGAKKSGAKKDDPTKDDAKKGAPAKKTSLPAFGFADDLLKKKAEAEGTDASAEETDASAEETESAPSDAEADLVNGEAASLDEATLSDAVRGVDPQAPTRVFDFIDRLQDAEEEEERRPVRLGTFVTFDLAGETFAMPVDPVRQVVRVSSITRVPHAPRPIRGVTNLRGRVIPVIDLRLRVGLEATELDRSARVVAVASRGRLLGLLVDAVHQVIHLDLDQIQPPPEDVMTLQSDYIRGVYEREDGLILLLDVDRALIIREAGAA